MVVVVLALGYGIWVFNRLVSDRNLVAQAFADIDVQLKRRADLVPQLVETVKAYAAYERQTLQAVVELRARASTLWLSASAGRARHALVQRASWALR